MPAVFGGWFCPSLASGDGLAVTSHHGWRCPEVEGEGVPSPNKYQPLVGCAQPCPLKKAVAAALVVVHAGDLDAEGLKRALYPSVPVGIGPQAFGGVPADVLVVSQELPFLGDALLGHGLLEGLQDIAYPAVTVYLLQGYVLQLSLGLTSQGGVKK